MKRRVMFCGSREWDEVRPIYEALVTLNPSNDIIIHGACPSGADKIADRLAGQMGFEIERHPAEWNKYPGKRAAAVRNEEMVRLAEHIFAFQIGDSPGTTMVIGFAHKYKKRFSLYKIPKGESQ